MKPIHATLLLMAGLLVLMNSPLRAQEKPLDKPVPDAAATPDTPPPPPQPPAGDSDRPRPDRGRGPNLKAAEEKPVPFIGVLTTTVSPELRAQFGLQEGFGLQVVEVMPDTPALTAGMKEHDILLSFDDQKLVNMEQLQTLVRSKKKDDQVNFTVISGGKQTQVAVKIGERLMPVRNEESRGRGGRFFPMNPPNSDRYNNYLGLREWQENLERSQERIRDYEKRFNEWTRNRSGDMPTPPAFDGQRRRDLDNNSSRDDDRGHHGFRDHERRDSQSGTVSRRDESGEYLLKRENDRTVFTVRPKEGAEQSWNVNDDTERAAVPEQYRAKLKMLEDVRKDMRRDGGPKDNDRRPAPDGPHDKGAPPAPGLAPHAGGTI